MVLPPFIDLYSLQLIYDSIKNKYSPFLSAFIMIFQILDQYKAAPNAYLLVD